MQLGLNVALETRRTRAALAESHPCSGLEPGFDFDQLFAYLVVWVAFDLHTTYKFSRILAGAHSPNYSPFFLKFDLDCKTILKTAHDLYHNYCRH